MKHYLRLIVFIGLLLPSLSLTVPLAAQEEGSQSTPSGEHRVNAF